MIETNLHQAEALRSDMGARRSFIINKIKCAGLEPWLMSFTCPFGEGVNIIVDIATHSNHDRRTRLLGAHYDGRELHDNIGGVLALLNLAGSLAASRTKHSWRIAFWDLEERFQQGSRAYVKTIQPTKPSAQATRFSCREFHSVYLDVDGIGLGSLLLVRHVSTRSTTSSRIGSPEVDLLMDCDVFCACGIPTYHVFSGTANSVEAYYQEGLVGCFRNMLSDALATKQNWEDSTPGCIDTLRRVIKAWEVVAFESACAEKQVLFLHANEGI